MGLFDFLSGDQGEYFKPVTENKALGDLYAQHNAEKGGFGAANAYGNGQMSLADAMGQLGEQGMGALMQNPLSGSKMATEQVQNNPLLRGMFGAGGTMDRTNADEQRLASQGFQLTPEDHEAYGQASGDISRMFGQQEQGLAQSLGDRGFGGAASGMGGAAFTGLAGNKNEQLGKMQMQIANQRMQNTMQRLGQTRQFLGQMNQEAGNQINNQFGRNMAGLNSRNAQGQKLFDDQEQNNNNSNQWNYMSQQDKRAAKPMSLGEAFGQGLLSSAGSIGAAPGNYVNSQVGGSGSPSPKKKSASFDTDSSQTLGGESAGSAMGGMLG